MVELSEKEFKSMNSPFNEFMKKYDEFRMFRKLLKEYDFDLSGKTILDAGCGSGYETELITKAFHPKELVAFDYMPEQIELAMQRGLSAELFVGDVTATGLESERFDAVFIFGILHHVPEWRKGLKEMNRVLKPGGLLLVEEPFKRWGALCGRIGCPHPAEASFSWSELIEGLKNAGFTVIGYKKQLMWAGLWRSYICQKKPAISSDS